NGMFVSLAEVRDEDRFAFRATVATEDGVAVGAGGSAFTRATTTTTYGRSPTARGGNGASCAVWSRPPGATPSAATRRRAASGRTWGSTTAPARARRAWRDRPGLLETPGGPATTCHKAQGSQWENVVVYDDGLSRTAED